MTFNLDNEINILISNGWLTKEEADIFFKQPELIDAINNSTSPIKENIFNALKLTSFYNSKVLILGQDPYPNPNHAHGLAFSSRDSVTPDSLKNVFKAIDKTFKSNLFETKKNELTQWAKNGVLLLNTSLTFEKYNNSSNLSASEKNKLQTAIQNQHLKLWKPFVIHIISKLLYKKETPFVMFLWGGKAQKIVDMTIKQQNKLPHENILILKSTHPSPLTVNRGGDFPVLAPLQFLQCNNFLGQDKIDWTII